MAHEGYGGHDGYGGHEGLGGGHEFKDVSQKAQQMLPAKVRGQGA